MGDLISVIIPVYNIAPYLDACLKSICNQTYKEFEVLIIDDGSTDGSFQKCQLYETKYPYITVYKQQHQGVSAARNLGIQKANGKYITFVDGDDTVDENYLEALEKYMHTNKYDIVFCGIKLIDAQSRKISIRSEKDNQAGVIKENFYDLYTGRYRLSVTGPVGKLFERARITENKICFDRNFINGEDTIFTLNYLQYCSNYYAINETFYNYIKYGRGSATELYNKFRMENEIAHLKFTKRWLLSNHIRNVQEILGYDIVALIRNITILLLKRNQTDFHKYFEFRCLLRRIQKEIEIPTKITKWKMRIVLQCVDKGIFFPLYIYYKAKFKIL